MTIFDCFGHFRFRPKICPKTPKFKWRQFNFKPIFQSLTYEGYWTVACNLTWTSLPPQRYSLPAAARTSTAHVQKELAWDGWCCCCSGLLADKFQESFRWDIRWDVETARRAHCDSCKVNVIMPRGDFLSGVTGVCMTKCDQLMFELLVSFSFSAENDLTFSVSFRFRAENEILFPAHFRFRPKKNKWFTVGL